MEPKYGMRAIIRTGFFSGVEGTLVDSHESRGFLVELSRDIRTWQPQKNLKLQVTPVEAIVQSRELAAESRDKMGGNDGN